MAQHAARETHIATELGEIVLLAVQENGEIIGYLPYHRTERTVVSLSETQLNRLFTKMLFKFVHEDSGTIQMYPIASECI